MTLQNEPCIVAIILYYYYIIQKYYIFTVQQQLYRAARLGIRYMHSPEHAGGITPWPPKYATNYDSTK